MCWGRAGRKLESRSYGWNKGKQDLGEEEVDKNDKYGGPDDGLNGGAAHALGSARGSHAVEASDGTEHEDEKERLDQPLDDVGIVEEFPGLVQVLVAVLVVHEDGDQAAAGDAAGVGDDG